MQTDWLFNFPLQRGIPMIVKGSGDCTAIDWAFLGGSIANWSFVCFTLIGLLAVAVIIRLARIFLQHRQEILMWRGLWFLDSWYLRFY